jgi:hypothetical protein
MKVGHLVPKFIWKHKQMEAHTQNGDPMFAVLLKEGKLANNEKDLGA